MNGDEHITVRVPAAVKDGLDELADEWETTRSELVRQQLRELVVEGEHALPPEVRIRLKRDQIKDESAPDKYRGFFRANMFSHAMDAWNAGLSAAEGRTVLQSFLIEHEMLFEEFDAADCEIDGQKVRTWAEGLIELYAAARLSDGWGEPDLQAYHNRYPHHAEVLHRLHDDRSVDCFDPDDVTGFDPDG